MPVISVESLSKSYRRHRRQSGFKGLIKDFFQREYESIPAVRNVSFHVEKGEFVGYLGPNGAGKTTTLKLLSGILQPDSGVVSVLNEEPFKRNKDFLRRIGFVMGSKSQLWWDLPALDTLRLMQDIYDVPESEFAERLNSLAQILNVSALLEIPVRKLSLGERMKLETICSLIHSPEIVFLDEPTIGLDLVSQEAIRTFLKWYNKEFGATILLTSHYIRDIEELCERILLINRGRIVFDGKQEELHSTYSDYILIDVENAQESLIIEQDEGNIKVGNTTRYLIRKTDLQTVSAALDSVGLCSRSLREISFEEVLKIKMQDES